MQLLHVAGGETQVQGAEGARKAPVDIGTPLRAIGGSCAASATFLGTSADRCRSAQSVSHSPQREPTPRQVLVAAVSSRFSRRGWWRAASSARAPSR